MSQGYFAGASLVNRLSWLFLSGALRWRLFSLRLKNRLKYAFKPQPCLLLNNEQTVKSFARFLSEGYRKLNVGGGDKNLDGFVNIDFVPHAGVKREVLANVLDLSFIPDGCLEQVHSNHVIEHLTAEEFRKQLAQYKRILAPRGILTMRCPNALGVCYGFWFGAVAENGREDFIRLGFPADEEFHNPQDGWYHRNLYGFTHWIYGDAGNITNQHLDQMTPSKVKAELAASGFEVLRISDPEASNIVVAARKK